MLQVLSNNRKQIKDALTLGYQGKKRITAWGFNFIPAAKRFDVCVIASSLDDAYSVYADGAGEVCIDPDAGTVVRFVKLRESARMAA